MIFCYMFNKTELQNSADQDKIVQLSWQPVFQ